MRKSIPVYGSTCDRHPQQSRPNGEIFTGPNRPSELEDRHVASPLRHPGKVDLENKLGLSNPKEDQEEAAATPPLTGIWVSDRGAWLTPWKWLLRLVQLLGDV